MIENNRHQLSSCSSREKPEDADQSNIFPRLKIPLGSSAFRNSRITRIWASPANFVLVPFIREEIARHVLDIFVAQPH